MDRRGFLGGLAAVLPGLPLLGNLGQTPLEKIVETYPTDIEWDKEVKLPIQAGSGTICATGSYGLSNHSGFIACSG